MPSLPEFRKWWRMIKEWWKNKDEVDMTDETK